MSLSDLLNTESRFIENWEKIISKGKFFEELLREDANTKWYYIKQQLEDWRAAIQKSHLTEGLSKEEQIEKMQQLVHAEKLVVCACFVNRNRGQLKEIFEGRKDKVVAGLNDFLKDAIDKNSLTNDEKIVLCSIFNKNELPSNVCKIPFVTGSEESNGTGEIHLLELRKLESFNYAMRNPAHFPHTTSYAGNIKTDFQQAIQNALNANVSDWENAKARLREEIDEMESPGQSIKTLELHNKKNDLSYMEEMGKIERYGVIWDINPLHHDARYEEPGQYIENLMGESVGLAAYVGIYRALRNKVIEKEVLYSGKIETETSADIKSSKIKISAVEYIPSKIKAAIESNFIDTFVMHEDNFKGAERNKIENMIKGKRFRIETINSNGIVIETFSNPE